MHMQATAAPTGDLSAAASVDRAPVTLYPSTATAMYAPDRVPRRAPPSPPEPLHATPNPALIMRDAAGDGLPRTNRLRRKQAPSVAGTRSTSTCERCRICETLETEGSRLDDPMKQAFFCAEIRDFFARRGKQSWLLRENS